MRIDSAARLCCILLFSFVAAGSLVTGCKTAPRVDWNTRVGIYTFDQAVIDMGPPDKQAKLTDNKLVAQWITHRNGGTGFSFGTGFYTGPVGVGVSQNVGSNYSDRVLVLTFGADNKLLNWSKNY